MNLEKEDLKAVGKVVDGSVGKAKKEILETIGGQIAQSEKRIISVLSREINDLSDINRAVITRVDQLDHRLSICERKLGIGTH